MALEHEALDKFEQLRKQAESVVQQQPVDESRSSSDVLTLIHELRVHQAELEIQNEGLKLAQKELSTLYRKFADLYELAPCGYITLNAKGLITRVNLTSVMLLGCERNRLLHFGLSGFIRSAWQNAYYGALRKSGETAEKQRIELPIKGKTA